MAHFHECIHVEWNPLVLNLTVLSLSCGIYPELRTFVLGQLLLYNLIHGVFESFSWRKPAETVKAAVILQDGGLVASDRKLLVIEEGMRMDHFATLVASLRIFPSEVLEIGCGFASMVHDDKLRPHLF